MSAVLDAPAGAALKESGMQLALDYSGAWQIEVLSELRGWLAIEKSRGMTTMTVERFRSEAVAEPPSSNCWGSLPRLAIKSGLIARALNADGSPVYRKAAAPKTHAHPVGVYRIVGSAQ